MRLEVRDESNFFFQKYNSEVNNYSKENIKYFSALHFWLKIQKKLLPF